MTRTRRADPPRMAVVWFEIAKAIAKVHLSNEANFVGPYICNIAKTFCYESIITVEEKLAIYRDIDEERRLQVAELGLEGRLDALWPNEDRDDGRNARLRWVTSRIRGLSVAHPGRIPASRVRIP